MTQCEEKDGKEVCFMEDAEGRELCPPHVTSAMLTGGAGQYACLVVRGDTGVPGWPWFCLAAVLLWLHCQPCGHTVPYTSARWPACST